MTKKDLLNSPELDSRLDPSNGIESNTSNKFTTLLTRFISGRVSMWIYILLFIILVIVPIISYLLAISNIMPSDTVMLIGGNYCNVLSALGASIAAGTGVVIHKQMKKHSDKLDNIESKHQEVLDYLKNLDSKTKK